uniref:Uncharacterized protein n=1 Tax=Parascaris univalens TaxID=6257 RepID=A0A914ZKI8_PARUN
VRFIAERRRMTANESAEEWDSFDVGGSSLRFTINILYGAIFFLVVLVFLKISLKIGTVAHIHRQKRRRTGESTPERRRRVKSDSEENRNNSKVSRCSSKFKRQQCVHDDTRKRLEVFDPSTITLDLQKEKFIYFSSLSPHYASSLTTNVEDVFLRSLLQLPPKTFLEERDDRRTKQSAASSLGKTPTPKRKDDQSTDRKETLAKADNFL